MSIAYLQSQDMFVANKVFPNIPVQKSSDSYFVYAKDQWFRSDAQRRAPLTESAGTGYDVTTSTYTIADPLSLHYDVSDRMRENAAAPMNLDREASLIVTQQLLLSREQEWAAKHFITGLWTGSSTGTDITPGTLWDASGATPIANIRAQIQACKTKTGFRPNTFVMADNVWTVLQDSADFVGRLGNDSLKIYNKDVLARILGIDNVYIAGAVQNTAAEGATAVMAELYSKDCLLTYSAPRPNIMQPSAGYTFSLASLYGAGSDGLRMKRFRMEHLEADRVEGAMAYDQKVVASDMGVFFNNVIS